MRRPVIAFGLVLLALLAVVRIADPLPTQALRTFYFDYLQRLSPRAYDPALPVRVVDVDEATLRSVGQWPWPRDRLAELVDRLWDMGAAVIVFDVLFPEEDRLSPSRISAELARQGVPATALADAEIELPDYDALFAEALRGKATVLGTALVAGDAVGSVTPRAGFVEIGDAPGASLPPVPASTPLLPLLADAASGIGMISVSPLGNANVIRSVPLVWSTEDGLMPALAVEGLRLALGVSTLFLEAPPGQQGISEALQIGDFRVPTSEDGQVWMRYRLDDPALYVSAGKILDGSGGEEISARIAGNIIFVGTSAAGLLDLRTTSLGQTVPGVSIHAQLVEQILTGDFLRRDSRVEAYEFLALLGLGLVVLTVITLSGPVASLAAGLVAAVAVLATSWFLFSASGILFDATFPLAGGLLSFFGLIAYQFVVTDRDKRRIRRSFAQYVAPEVLGEIEASGHGLELGGTTRTLTVMFCDIRNFTRTSEGMSPTELVAMLNSLFTALGREILDERGTIDKFIGDAIMAFWNAPLEIPDHPARGAAAALGMRRALKAFNAGRGDETVALAIGLATGAALVGNIGSAERFNYSAVGDVVNRASRIETSCRHVRYDILLAADTAQAAAGMASLDAGRLELKGVSERLAVRILVGDAALAASPGFAALSARHEALVEALSAGDRTAWQALLAECRDMAGAVEPGLAEFYDRIAARTDDFTA